VLVVEDAAGRRLGVAYDAGSPTTALQHALRGLDALVIETNHDEVLLRSSGYPPSVRARIAGRGGHLSNSQAAALVAQGAHAALQLVVLAHLSDRCNRPDLALAAMRSALRGTAFAGRLVVAGQDAPTAPVTIGAGLEQLTLPLGRRR
jgi:phosphoribosyl 1,2-cyclic phosphodiesterase